MPEGAFAIYKEVQAATERADPEPVAGVLVDAFYRIGGKGRSIRIAVGKVSEFIRLSIELVEPAVCRTHPIIVTAVLEDRVDIEVAQAGGVSCVRIKAFVFSRGRIYFIQAFAVGADPNIALGILQQVIDEGVGKGGIDEGELLFIAVVAIYSPAPCSHPEISVAVFEEGRDKVIADGMLVVLDVLIDREIVAIIFIESVTGSKPHKTPAVLQDAGDVRLGEACVRADVFQL